MSYYQLSTLLVHSRSVYGLKLRVSKIRVVDQQFIDQMGSSYLMAHGMGKPVEDAETEISFDKTGVYYVYVRTYNWTSPWSESKGPGRFQLSLNGNVLPVELGATGNSCGRVLVL